MTRPADGGGRWLDSFNRLPVPEARATLLTVCSSMRWAELVTAARPYSDLDVLKTHADRVWLELEPRDWREALEGHPRIGGRGGAAPGHSEVEQAGVTAGPGDLLRDIEKGNLEYERRFGHVFLIAAAGRGAEEILSELTRRMENTPADELRAAAEEHRRITSSRLDRIANDSDEGSMNDGPALVKVAEGTLSGGRTDRPSGL